MSGPEHDPSITASNELALQRGLLVEIKSRVRRAQATAAAAVNVELLRLYWDVGRMIASRRDSQAWGQGVIRRLAAELRNELPEEKGFSETNLKRMVRFWREYPDLYAFGPPAVAHSPGTTTEDPIGPPPVAQLSEQNTSRASHGLLPVHSLDVPARQVLSGLGWAHHVVLMEQIADLTVRLWYARQSIQEGWSREALRGQIKAGAHARQGGAVNNFGRTLPPPNAEVARQLLKDPYIFDFLTLEGSFRERELEAGLLVHIQRFLLELGRGFAFVGRQYRLQVGDSEFYLDLLFYHIRLRCFVVVDLKTGDFKPEHAGKMNFYCSVVDDQLRQQGDAPTLGLILCQTKDRIIAEYALRDIHKPIGVADYEITRALPTSLASSLPSIAAIEAELSETLSDGTT